MTARPRAEWDGDGPGEMAARVRAFPWETTPLGPQAGWSPALRIARDLCLNSRFPIALWWGDDLTFLYNDAYRSSLGASKHPGALGRSGREVWAEIWPIVEGSFAQVLAGGPATWEVDQQLFVNRNGYLEEAFFTYGVSAIREADGRFAGFLNAVSETTARALAARRLGIVRNLATGTAGALTVAAACAGAAAILAGGGEDVPFALLYLRDADGARARLAGAAGVAPGGPFAPPAVALDEAAGDGWADPLATTLRDSAPLLLDDLAARFAGRTPPGGPWDEGARAAVVVPLLPEGAAGQASGVLIAGVSPRRALDADYRGFFDLVAKQIAGAIAIAAGREAERAQAEALASLAARERAARDEAEAAVRARDEFLSIASHELRNPLAGLTGNLQLLARRHERGTLTPDGLARQLANLREAGDRLTRLTDDLLDVSRLRTGQLPLRPVALDLAALVADAVELVRPSLRGHDLTVEHRCQAARCPIRADPDRLGQVLANLLDNAIKYSPAGGAIRVTIAPEAGGVSVRVADSGIGLPPEATERIFEPFGRAANARARNLPGMGLGLYICRQIVAAHGGTLRAASPGDGAGTTFALWLPGEEGSRQSAVGSRQ